jgi:Na+-transporting methylmalonyl-CoA/oxaloacetate decarboxylase beta subunit
MLVSVFATLLLAGALKYPIQSAAAIALASTLNAPAAIYAANSLNPDLVGPLGFASLLLPLILLWAALRLSGQPFADQEFDASQAPDSLPNVNPSSQVIFSLVITIIIGVFFRAALPLAAGFLLGSLLRPGPVARLLPAGFAAALTRTAVVLVSLLVGASLVAGVMFTPTALKAWLIALGGLVLGAAIFWLILRPQINRGVINLERLGGLPAVMGAVSAIELVSLILTCIVVTVASLIS